MVRREGSAGGHGGTGDRAGALAGERVGTHTGERVGTHTGERVGTVARASMASGAPLAPHHSEKARGNHPGVVHDQEITGPKKSGELAESVMRHRAAGSIE